jgi:uncharacterized protein (TIGR02328 family)
MRLWHQSLISKLPNNQLLGQHRECCALRGLSWGKKHSVVDYVFTYPMEALFAYHQKVIAEMRNREYKVTSQWEDPNYRGRNCDKYYADVLLIERYLLMPIIYPQHDQKYLFECLENLKQKGIYL